MFLYWMQQPCGKGGRMIRFCWWYGFLIIVCKSLNVVKLYSLVKIFFLPTLVNFFEKTYFVCIVCFLLPVSWIMMDIKFRWQHHSGRMFEVSDRLLLLLLMMCQCKHCGRVFASHAAHDSHVRRIHQSQLLSVSRGHDERHVQTSQQQQQQSTYKSSYVTLWTRPWVTRNIIDWGESNDLKRATRQ